jgi:enamine deaminase RidA (YjgF/YER057c/UK114 family)
MTQQAFQLINPAGLYDPAPRAYSHVARLEPGVRLVYLAGQVGEDVEGKLSSDFGAQVRQALANLRIALAAAGAGISDVVKLTVLIVDHSESKLAVLGAELGLVWGQLMKPACTLIPVPRLALDALLIEVEAIAAVAV